MSELLEVLQRTISADPNDQQRAISYIDQACAQNYPEFLRQLASILAATENVAFVRQAAGLQLKNTLVANEEERRQLLQQRWIGLQQEVRQFVKECIIKTLGTESRPSSAAQCVSAIACIEIPHGLWPDVMDLLKSNVTNPQSSELLKESSLEALGYICQSLPPSFMETYANNVLTAIVYGMREEEPSIHVKKAAVTAMLNSLEFTHMNFQNERERNVIMEVVCHSTQSSDKDVNVLALQCLVKIMSLYYQFMEKYMVSALFPITIAAIKSNEDDIVLQGIEFWSNVCEEETGLAYEAEEAAEEGRPPSQVSKHYAKGALQYLIPLLTEILCHQDEDPEEDDWIPAKSASVCIMLLAQCCQDDVIAPTLPFISENFANPDWHRREAAVMAFGSILDGPDPSTLSALVQQAIIPLIDRVCDSHLAVRDTAIWAIGRVCEICVDLVSNQEVLQRLLPALFSTLQQVPRIASNSCWTISSLVKAIYQTAVQNGTDASGEPDTFMLSSVYQQMVQELIKTSERQDANVNLRNAAYEALMELIKNSPKDCYAVVQQTTIVVLSKIEQLLQMEQNAVSSSDRSQLRDLISQLCATLQSVLRKMRPSDAPQIADTIMTGLFQIMNRFSGRDNGAVMEEALMAVSALITVVRTDFAKYMDAFKPLLYHAMSNHAEKDLCISALGVVTDLCTAFEGKIIAYSDELVRVLITLLNDGTVDRTIKCHIIQILGDMITALGPQFAPYFEHTMRFVDQAVEASSVPVAADDIDQADYVTLLRESCLVVYMSMIQSFRETDEHKAVLQQYLPRITQLLNSIASSQPPAPESLLVSAISLVGDLVNTFGVLSIPLMDSESVVAIVQRLRRSKQNKCKTALTWVSREMQRVRRQATIA
uniref:Importin N-terminal domain-containing protein n=1 Tax=Bursaphelenchus xylophilus TaxID=6326 RepID=A0A1I7S7A1_BURXY